MDRDHQHGTGGEAEVESFGRLEFERRKQPEVGIALYWWWWIGALVVCLIPVVMLWRQPLADWLWPDTRAEQLRDQAVAALAQQRLTTKDGTGAREYYEAALAIDPDRSEARAGLVRVAQAALAQARSAIAVGHFEQAHASLRLARELSVPRAQADAVADQLRRREAAHAGIDSLLQQAQSARIAGHLYGSADAALPLYQRVLELQPRRIEALEGREDALAELLQAADQALAQGQLVNAAAMIATANDYDSGYADLPQSRAHLARTTERTRQRAAANLRVQRLEQAAAAYRDLLQIDANDPAAKLGAEQVGLAYAARAERAAADFNFEIAEAALRQAQALAPSTPAVVEAALHVQRARQSQAHLQPASTVSRQLADRVGQLLAEANAAQARGDLLAPPGESAYDKLRAASALAPQSLAVRQAALQLLPAAKVCFERALRDNQLASAHACLDALRVLDNDVNAVMQAQRRLAQRWLAVGDERLGAGELAAAAAALTTARRLDPETPELAAFAERVRKASAGVQ